MTIYEIMLFAAILVLAVFLSFKLTRSNCKWFGHTWYRPTVWARTYRCRTCGEERKAYQ